MEIRFIEIFMMKLLKEVFEEGLISVSQMIKGFYRMEESFDDFFLDIFFVRLLFEFLVFRVIFEGWFDSFFIKFNIDVGEVLG